EQQYITFRDDEDLQQVLERHTTHHTTLTVWFHENMNNIAARIHTYIDFPVHYTWDASHHKWKLRKTSTNMIGRLYMAQPSEGERYYLRILLTCIKGA